MLGEEAKCAGSVQAMQILPYQLLQNQDFIDLTLCIGVLSGWNTSGLLSSSEEKQ